MSKKLEESVLVQMEIKSGPESGGIFISLECGYTTLLKELIGKEGTEEVKQFVSENLSDSMHGLADLIGQLIVKNYIKETSKNFGGGSKAMPDILGVIREFMKGKKN